SFHRNSDSMICRLNGVNVNADSIGITDQLFSPQGFSNIGGYPFTGGVSEIISKDFCETDEQKIVSENYLFAKYGILSKKVFFFGDSWTAGVGATPTDMRYSTVLCSLLNSIEVNLSRSGTVLQRTAPIENNNFRDQYASRVTAPTNANDILVIMYGINDIRFN